MNSPWPCCCNSGPDTDCGECAGCTAGTTPCTLEFVVTGFADDLCANSADFNITFTLGHQGSCIWGNPLTYTDAGGMTIVAGGGVDCECDNEQLLGTPSIYIAARLAMGVLTLEIWNNTASSQIGADLFVFTLSLSGDCVDTLLTPQTMTFDSQTAGNCDFAHDGSGATVTVQAV